MSRAAEQLRILAFESFDAGSHRAVREAITRHSRHCWTWITRPGRSWKWRMRAAAIEMIELAHQQGVLPQLVTGEADRNDQEPQYDAIFLTSLMSAADLRALLLPPLRDAPMVLYMHENQAAYPQGHETERSAEHDLHYPLTNLTSVLAADAVIWNSAWNRDSFLDGIARILAHGTDLKMPDDLRERVHAKSSVIWPPVEWPLEELSVAHDELPASPADTNSPAQVLHNADRGKAAGAIRVVWPHRWEHDKGPEQLLAVARQHSEPLNLRWTILGERYRTVPPAITTFQREFADRIDHIGYEPDREAYRQHLARCDWVVSTAHHEFFGIAVVEALLAGCLPWLPQRLSYPELLPSSARGLGPDHPPGQPAAIRSAIQRHLLPAVAPNAAILLDESIESLIEPHRIAR